MRYVIKADGRYIMDGRKAKHFTAGKVIAFLENYKKKTGAVKYYKKYATKGISGYYVYMLPDGTRRHVIVTPIYPTEIVRVVRKPRKEQVVRKPIPKEDAIIKIPEIKLPESRSVRKPAPIKTPKPASIPNEVSIPKQIFIKIEKPVHIPEKTTPEKKEVSPEKKELNLKSLLLLGGGLFLALKMLKG